MKQPSSKNLDHLGENPSPQIFLNGVSPSFGNKSPSTGTGLLGNKIVPESHLQKTNQAQGIYNLPSKFLTLQEADNVVEVFDLTKGEETCYGSV